MATSTAKAHWEGTLFEGQGQLETGNGALRVDPLTWNARTGEEEGATPEHLLAGALAGCYCMALSGKLAGEGTPAESLDAKATATFVPGTGVTGIELELEASIPGIDQDIFERLTQDAKDSCPVSQALSVPITLTARLLARA